MDNTVITVMPYELVYTMPDEGKGDVRVLTCVEELGGNFFYTDRDKIDRLINELNEFINNRGFLSTTELVGFLQSSPMVGLCRLAEPRFHDCMNPTLYFTYELKMADIAGCKGTDELIFIHRK